MQKGSAPIDWYSFDMPGSGRMEVTRDTKFGGVLYVEKTTADGVWVTTLSAFDGWHSYRIVLEKRLEGEERNEFVRLATDMIERELSR